MSVNMDYCKFQNTLHALQECSNAWDKASDLDESKAKAKLIELMIEILEEKGFEVEKED